MNGNNGHHTYDGAAPLQQLPLAQPWRIWRQCPRCWGRMTGPLAGVVATRRGGSCVGGSASSGAVAPRQ